MSGMNGSAENSEGTMDPRPDGNVEMSPLVPHVVGIYTSPAMGAPMVSHESIKATAGVGLEGDRYAAKTGAYSEARIGKAGRIPDTDRQVSIISSKGIAEANAALKAQGIKPFSYEETRRNLVLNIDPAKLKGLVGKRFWIGGVLMEGVEQCTPCTRPGIVRPDKEQEAASVRVAEGRAFEQAFESRGGLRARIISSGEINLQDPLSILVLNQPDN